MAFAQSVGRVVTTSLVTLLLSVNLLAQTEKKVATAVLIDNTGSMRSQFELVVDLSRGIVTQAQPRGPVRLFAFMPQGSGSSSIALISSKVEWTDDKRTLDGTLDNLYIVAGQTKLLDAITSIALDLSARVALEPDAFSGKTIFLVTDGEDRSSKTGAKDLIKLLKDAGIQVNAIGLIEELDTQRSIGSGHRQKAKELLEKLTKETGGRVVFANPHADADEVLRKLGNK